MATINLTVAEFLAATEPFSAADDVTIVDTGANIAAMTPEQFAQLATFNVDAVDASDDTLALSVDQYLALGQVVTLSAGDQVTLRDTAATLQSGTIGGIAALAGDNIDIIEASDGALTFTLNQYIALGTVVFSPSNVVTIRGSSTAFAGGSPEDVAELATKNVDFIDSSDDLLVYSLAQFNALGPVGLTASDLNVVTGLGAEFGALTAAEITAMATKGVDVLDATDNAVTLSATQAAAIAATSMSFANGDAVTVADTATAIAALTAAEIAALGTAGVDVFDADGPVTLTGEQAAALADSGIAFADNDVVVADTGANLAALTAQQIAALGTKGVVTFDASDDAATFTAAQASALAGTNIAFAAEDVVGVSDTGANISTLTATQIGDLIAQGVDSFDPSDDAIALSLAQINAFGATLTGSNAVTLADSGANISALTDAGITALAGQGVVAIDATNNALTLSLEQFNSLGTVALTASDVVALSATSSQLLSLSGAQLANLDAKGIDVLDSTNNYLSLTLAQYNSLGAFQFASNDTLRIYGTVGGDKIVSRAAQTIIEGGNGNDYMVGGAGADVIKSGAGNDRAYGQDGNDLIVGDSGNDTLYGANGNDTMSGGSGNDYLSGGSGADVLKGLSGNDRLYGGDGNDQLNGGYGKDYLVGGAGKDAFIFDTRLSKAYADRVVDFDVRFDSIYLDNAIFKKLGKGSYADPVKIDRGWFTVGKEAKDGNDYLIYDNKNGVLYYDADGSGKGKAVEIATLSKNLKLTYHDFFVV